MTRRTGNLLRDLAVLLTRHPSKEWVRLADLLENDESRSQVVLFLREISSLNHTPANQRERKKTASAQTAPRKGKKEYVELHDLELSRLSIIELRELVRLQNLSYSNKDSKQRLIGRLLKGSSGASPRSRRAVEARKEDSSDYAQWAEIIMGRNKSKY